jgi:hypothetical protein
MTVHAAPDYAIRPQGDPPLGYPTRPHPDSFQPAPAESTFDQRRAEYIAHILKNPAPRNTKPVWYELVRMAGGGRAHEGILHSALDFIDARKDCSDFVLHGILRMLYQFSSPLPQGEGLGVRAISDEILYRAKQTTLNFKYFPNEPGLDSLCTWTENHYILFTSAAYLAGQLYPDQVFTNSGETGKQKIELNRNRILRWLDLRFRTGFSEWLSHVYYDEDLTALLSLYDFAQDDEIRRKAEMVIDLLLLDMALNSFKGVLGSTHGRAYENTKKWASNEGTIDTLKLLFGMGIYSAFDNMSAPAFALSSYRVPKVIKEIASTFSPPIFEENGGVSPERSVGGSRRGVENRQRMGLKLNEMEKWNIHPDNFEDGMLYLTLEAYLHPRTIANTLQMFDTCNWWENSFLEAFKPYRGLLRTLNALRGLPLLARILERDVCRNTREEVNIYTYRTPDYMLSTAQDYRKGYGGDQQHIWQATLGPDAVCFTTHPAKIEGVSPNYWAGSGLLPRAAQYKNLTIVIYKIEKIPALYVPIRHFFTHAWLPKDKFDEVVERPALSSSKGGWIFARKDDGYLALRSMQPYVWTNDELSLRGRSPKQSPVKRESAHVEEIATLSAVARTPALPLRSTSGTIVAGGARDDIDNEIIADGAQNIWLCQLGRKADDGAFEQFIAAIRSAELNFSELNVEYRSPGNGLVRFGWEGPFSVDGVEIPLHDYPRYDNPYVQAEFDPTEIRVAAGERELYLNWGTGERTKN